MSPGIGPILECHNLHKRFPGVIALDDVSLSVGAGEVHALVGENGAGKSTLVKIVAGQLAPDAGTVVLSGSPVSRFAPRAARQAGVTMVPQHPDLFLSLTALENLFVGDWARGLLGSISWTEMTRRARAVLDQMQVSIDLGAVVETLTVADRQLLQIARALLARSGLLILDEPTAPLGHDDTVRLFRLIRHLNEQGVSIVYISHRLAEVFELAQRVTILRDGALVDTLPIDQVTRDSLVTMMVGSQAPRSVPDGGDVAGTERLAQARALLSVQGLGSSGSFEQVSFDVAPGEIVGVAGVAGSGRNELLRALAGVQRPTAGRVFVDGAPMAGGGPGPVRDMGVSFVPADRHHEALVLPMSVTQNVTLGRLGQFANRLGLIGTRRERDAARDLVGRLDVRARGLEQPVESLSGGNQQKVALASRLLGGPRVLLLEEPTQGVDVGARAEIHRLMAGLVREGVGIVLVSSDLPELLALSDRVLVMHRGKLVGSFTREKATQQAVLDLALGTEQAGVTHAGQRRHRAPIRELGLGAILILLTLVVSLRAPGFADAQNIVDILVNNSHLLIAAVGMTLVILTAGIDISVGSMLAVCATVAGACAEVGMSPVIVLGGALLAGAVLGGINAGLITGARVPPIIATLATLTLFRHVLIHFTGGRWINLPGGFREFGLSTPLGIPLPVWIAVATAAAGMVAARWTVLGRSAYAIGSNPQAAEHQGISVSGVRVRVYLLMGLLTGLAAFAYIARYSAIQTNAGLGFEMVVITAVVVGGTNIFGGSGTVLGTAIGVLLLGVIAGSLTHLHIEPTWERAFQGGLILMAVVIDTLQGRRAGGGP